MKNKARSIFTKLAFVLLLCTIWQAAALSKIYPPMLFPSIGDIWRSSLFELGSGELAAQLAFSLLIISKGIAIGMALSVALLAISKASPHARELVDMVGSILHPLPGIALLPLVILWLGVGENSVLFVIVHSVVWPMLTSLMGGVDSIPPIYLQAGENYGFNLIEKICKIYIPASMPSLISGIRISWARAWRALISSEMVFGAIGSTGGIGWFIFQKRVFMDTAGIYAGLLFIIVVGIVVEDIVFSALERLTVKKWGMKS